MTSVRGDLCVPGGNGAEPLHPGQSGGSWEKGQSGGGTLARFRATIIHQV